MPFGPSEFLLCGVAVTLGAVLQAATGLGAGLIITPLLAVAVSFTGVSFGLSARNRIFAGLLSGYMGTTSATILILRSLG